MATPPLLPHSLADRIVDNIGDWVTFAVTAYAGLHGTYLGVRRWLQRRARRRELVAARDEALRVLLDGAREVRREMGDAEDIEERTNRRRILLDQARDRLWLAQGKQRSGPSAAPTPPDDSEDA